MDSKLLLAIIMTGLLAILSGVNAFQPSAPAVVTEQSSLKQKLSFQFFRPAPSYPDTLR